MSDDATDVSQLIRALNDCQGPPFHIPTGKPIGQVAATALSALQRRCEALERVGRAVLYHDERGQGVGYSEAMNELAALLTKPGGR